MGRERILGQRELDKEGLGIYDESRRGFDLDRAEVADKAVRLSKFRRQGSKPGAAAVFRGSLQAVTLIPKNRRERPKSTYMPT